MPRFNKLQENVDKGIYLTTILYSDHEWFKTILSLGRDLVLFLVFYGDTEYIAIFDHSILEKNGCIRYEWLIS